MMSKRVPKLRFKEFSGEWEEKELEKVYDFYPTNSFSRDKLNYEKGTVKNIHYGDIHTKFSTLFDITKEQVPFINSDIDLTRIKEESYCLEGDLIFADASEDVDDIGKSMELINLNNEKVLSGLHTLLARQKEKKLVRRFAGYLFKSNYIREQIKKEAQGAKVLGISTKRLSNIKLFFPKDPNEQQKIANTLSFLDKLIESLEQKIEALKKHKKGLMQQLFPQEGEKTPKLRFKEFRGEWEENIVDNVFDIFAGGDIPKENFSAHKTQEYSIPIISNGIGKKSLYGWTTKPKINKPSITVSARGTIGWTNLQKKPFFPIVRLIVLTPKVDINLIYAYYYMKKIENSYKYAKVGIPQLTKPMIKNTKIIIPKDPKEQQKIANTLSSLDNLIEAQSKKVEALKKHKKGLMQQMFVSEEN